MTMAAEQGRNQIRGAEVRGVDYHRPLGTRYGSHSGTAPNTRVLEGDLGEAMRNAKKGVSSEAARGIL